MTEQLTYHEEPRAALHEPGMDEIHHMPSAMILDGIYLGRISNPEALRAYFLRRRAEFLDAHPDREGELSGPGELGRWHGLVYSETEAEYEGLATFCDNEAIRRTAELTPQEANRQTHHEGVANLRRIGDAWRQRAMRLHKQDAQEPSLPPPGVPKVIVEPGGRTVPRLVIGEPHPLRPAVPGIPRLVIRTRPRHTHAPAPTRHVR